MLAAYLERTLKAAGLPVVSVHIGTRANRQTWSAVLAGASEAQIAQARTLLDTTDIADATVAQSAHAVQFDGETLIKAVVLWAAGKLGVAPAVARQEILAIYRQL